MVSDREKRETLESLRITTTGVLYESQAGKVEVLAMAVSWSGSMFIACSFYWELTYTCHLDQSVSVKLIWMTLKNLECSGDGALGLGDMTLAIGMLCLS
jgi:hypothetical protein